MAKRIADFDHEGSEAFAKSRAARLVHQPKRKADIVAMAQAAMASLMPAAHAQAVHALAQGDLIAAASRIMHPVLIIAGADDVITPFAGTERLFATLRARPRQSGTREAMHVIGDAGHAVFLEAASDVAAAAQAFCGEAP